MAPAPTEIELKLRLARGSRRILETTREFAVRPHQLHQLTTYFDTPDAVLAKAGLALRVRQTGAIRIQTMKAKEDQGGVASNRTEWEWPIGQDTPNLDRFTAVPKLARILPKIRGRLEPLFVTDIRRTIRLIHLDDCTVVEASIDEGTIKAGTRRESVNELELELKAGSIGPMYRLAADLQTLARSWISPETKFARGLRLCTRQVDGAQIAQPTQLGRHVRAASGFHEIVSTALGHLTANVPPTLRGSAEGVHQMRVALRTARAALQLFEPLLDASTRKPFDAQLQRFGDLFGTARDWDVFCLQMLPATIRELPRNTLADLNRAAEVQRQVAHTAVTKAVQGQDFSALILRLAIWAETGLIQPNALGDRMRKRLSEVAPKLLDRVDRRARRNAKHVRRLSAQDLHSLRKSLKRVRYDVQTLSGLFPHRAVKLYQNRCKHVLEILGTINDATMSRRLARRLAANNRPNLAKPAAVLVRCSLRRGRKARSGLKEAVKAFKRAPTFWS